MRVVVVGGGISGLTCAYRLSADSGPAIQTTVLEPGAPGGLIQSHNNGRFLIEAGPDSVVAHKPQALELLREIGLGDQVIESRSGLGGAQLLVGGILRHFPVGILMRPSLDPDLLLGNSLLGSESRARIAREARVPPRGTDDESVAQFFRRRLGSEFLELIVAPVVAGVYGCSVSSVSMRSAFPALFETEREHGSIVGRGQPRTGAAPKRSPFLSLKRGMGDLIRCLSGQIAERCSLRSEVALELSRDQKGWVVQTNRRQFRADQVVVALPGPLAGKILGNVDPALAARLSEIPYSRSLVGCFGFSRDVTDHLTGTGVLVPEGQGLDVLACTAVHHKFRFRCANGDSLVRLFIGAQRASQLWDLPDSELLGRMLSDLGEILGSSPGAPVYERLFRWKHGLPEYQVGHYQLAEEISERLKVLDGLHLVGNFIDGVGISDCIRHANRVVSQLLGSK